MLPQVNTLVNHVLEQFLMYVVGTTATQNITGGVFELVKSLVLILPAFFACVGAFSSSSSSSSASGSSGDPELSKVFALFAGLLLSYAYFAAATERWQLHDWPVLLCVLFFLYCLSLNAASSQCPRQGSPQKGRQL